jgi:hypothetical protein
MDEFTVLYMSVNRKIREASVPDHVLFAQSIIADLSPESVRLICLIIPQFPLWCCRRLSWPVNGVGKRLSRAWRDDHMANVSSSTGE